MLPDLALTQGWEERRELHCCRSLCKDIRRDGIAHPMAAFLRVFRDITGLHSKV